MINNSLSTYLLELEGRIKLDDYYNSYASHPVLWRSGVFAQELHSWFLEKFLKTGKWEELHLGKKEMGMTRFSINSVLWFGDEMRKFAGVVPGDDEEYLSCIYPTRQGMSNAWNGDAIVAHFAFFTQREELDKKGILEQYGDVCAKQWHEDEKSAVIYDAVQAILKQINVNEAELMKRPSPYKHVVKTVTMRQRIKRLMPKVVLDLKAFFDGRKERSGFIG